MPFLNLSCTNFRNLQNTTIDLLAKEVYFVGENGQGKTNFLESLYYLAYGSSFRTHTEQEIVKEGETAFSVRTMFKDDNDSVTSIHSEFQKGRKKILKNQKKIADRKELVNSLVSRVDLLSLQSETAESSPFLKLTSSHKALQILIILFFLQIFQQAYSSYNAI